MNTRNIDWLTERIGESVRSGRSMEKIYVDYCRVFPTEQVQEAMEKFKEITDRIRLSEEPASLEHRGLINWYAGPSPTDRYWPSLYKSLLKKNWELETVASIDRSSTKVVSYLQPPGLSHINTRGMILGYAQSGKTIHFSSIIAKAADVGYKFFIILTGLTNILRSQTQYRLERDLIDLNPKNWTTLTSPTNDFFPGYLGNADVFLTDHYDDRVLCVVKKNISVLRRLLNWLKTANQDVMSNCPIMVIDDEPEQASMKITDSDEKQTTVYRSILDILSLLPKVAYIGYTSTPFANIFIDPSVPQDLYPRDFIIDLPIPTGYFDIMRASEGGKITLDKAEQEKNDFDIIRNIIDDDLSFLISPSRKDKHIFEPKLTSSLKDALHYFWMAASARLARGDNEEPSTMLIYTSQFTQLHERLQQLIKNHQANVSEGIQTNKMLVIDEFKKLWIEECSKKSNKELDKKDTSFEDLLPYLITVINDSETLIEGNRTTQRLEYNDQIKTQIIISGSPFTRELTIEGLVVGFFIRSNNLYNTLLQVRRMSGYHHKYVDLIRIWMNETLEISFYDFSKVEQEIRDDFKRYELEGLTPIQLGVRIRTHPALNTISQLKMQSATDLDISYSGIFLQTIQFKFQDITWLTNNINATRSLISLIGEHGVGSMIRENAHIVFRNVPVEYISSFLGKYYFYENDTLLQNKLLRSYIDAQNKFGDLLWWNVVIIGCELEDDDIESLDLGLGYSVPLLNHPRLLTRPANEQIACLNAIVTSKDLVADLNVAEEEIKGKTIAEVLSLRPFGTGLLLIYPISKLSELKNRNNTKHISLKAVEHLIGIALAFPEAKKLTPQRYKTTDLSGKVLELSEWQEEK
jgi:hypothetical protein